MSYMLAMLILIAQVGIPMHLHYCKGILESVSVFVTNTCGDHTKAAPIATCCKDIQKDTCHKEDSDCCHDQVRVLQQDIQSLIPFGIKWVDISTANSPQVTYDPVREVVKPSVFTCIQDNNSGPPRYILFHSLVYYG